MTEQSPEYTTTPAAYITLVAKPRTEAERTALIVSTPWVSVRHGNVLAERDALQKLVEQLEGCVDEVGKLEFAIECYEKDLSAIAAAVPADKYPSSKDWRDGSTLERIQWLHSMYECAKSENARLMADVLSLQSMLDAVGAGGVGPLRKSNPAEKQQIAVPEGWRLVPEEATREMILAFFGHPKAWYETWKDDYRAMLNAAPQPPVIKESLTTESAPTKKVAGLSDARINGIYHLYKYNTSPIGFARAIIEAAHGITAQATDHFVDANKMPDAPSRWLTTV